MLFLAIVDFIRWKLNSKCDDKFCPFCEACKSERHIFNKWKTGDKVFSFVKTCFGSNIVMVPCLLHAKIRVTEKLLKLALERAIECGKEDNLFEVLENVKYISMMLTFDN
jgi:hypothetical protein